MNNSINNTTSSEVNDPSAMFDLRGRAAVVTGASSGLGERFASVLAGAGADLVVSARRTERLEALAERINSYGATQSARVVCEAGDITSDGMADRLVGRAVEEFGRLDIVVNNAGVSRVLPALDDTVEDFAGEVAINLIAPFALCQAGARAMVANPEPSGGSIINIGSVLGFGGGGRLRAAAYAAAKGGLHNLTRELASQWARKGVRVNAIAPGWFESEMTSDMFQTDGGQRYIVDNTPMGRAGRHGELDGALLYLASSASSYMTGQILTVDGGWTAI